MLKEKVIYPEYEEIFDSLQLYYNVLHETKKELEIFVKNKNFPLEDRWKLFIESGLGEHKTWYQDFESYDINDFLAERERYKHIDVENIIDHINDRKLDYEDDDENNVDYYDELIYNLKEEILQKFIKSFEYGW